MKNLNNFSKYRRQSLALFMAAFLLVGSSLFVFKSPAKSYASSSDSLSLSPASGAQTVGNNFNVTLNENSNSDAVDGVQASISYSANLQFVSTTYSSSAFAVQGTDTGGNGTVTIARGAFSALTGSQQVGVITFKAVSAGTGSLSFGCIYVSASSCGNGSGLFNNSGSNVLGVQTNASFSISNPASSGGGTTGGGSTGGSSNGGGGSSAAGGKTSTGSSSSKGGTSSGGSAGTTTTPTPGTTPTASNGAAPVISAIKITSVTANQAIISWQTDVSSSSVVNYGLSTKYGLSASSTGGTSHSVTLSAPNIVPGQTYYFDVQSTGANGATATSANQTFNTPGFAVTVRVVDSKGKAIAGAKVTLGGQTVSSDKNGNANFTNVSAGVHQVVIKSGIKTTKGSIQVGKYDPATHAYANQNFSLTATKGVNEGGIAAGVIIALIIAAGAYYFVLAPRITRMSLARAASGPEVPGIISSNDPDKMGLTPPTAITPPSNTVAPTQPPSNPVNPGDHHDKPGPGTTISPNSGS